jgi:hypothetical protein
VWHEPNNVKIPQYMNVKAKDSKERIWRMYSLRWSAAFHPFYMHNKVKVTLSRYAKSAPRRRENMAPILS